MVDLRRTLDREPPQLSHTIGGFALVLFVATVLAVGIMWAAQLGDDVQATRERVESMEPCRR